jgi:hypothetical protein
MPDWPGDKALNEPDMKISGGNGGVICRTAERERKGQQGKSENRKWPR